MLKQNPFSVYDFLGYVVPGALLLFALMECRFFGLNSPETSLLSGEAVKFALYSYVVGHLLSLLSALTIERYAIWRFGYPSRFLLRKEHPGFFAASSAKRQRRWVRVAVAIVIVPVTLLDVLLGKALGLSELYARPLDEGLASIVSTKLEALRSSLGLATTNVPEETDIFRLAYHYAVERAPAHLPKMQNYVAIYGFLRTSCLIAVVLLWTMLLHCHWFMAGALWLTAFLLFVGFIKFYRRFSLEALMAISVVVPSSISNGTATT